MNNKKLLSQIEIIQNTGYKIVKVFGYLLLNPFSIGIVTYFIMNKWGGSWLYMWLPSLIIVWVFIFCFFKFNCRVNYTNY